jgi:hypothetical protein
VWEHLKLKNIEWEFHWTLKPAFKMSLGLNEFEHYTEENHKWRNLILRSLTWDHCNSEWKGKTLNLRNLSYCTVLKVWSMLYVNSSSYLLWGYMHNFEDSRWEPWSSLWYPSCRLCWLFLKLVYQSQEQRSFHHWQRVTARRNVAQLHIMAVGSIGVVCTIAFFLCDYVQGSW